MNINPSANTLKLELDWFQSFLSLRIKITFEKSSSEEEISDLLPPDIDNQKSQYAKFIKTNNLGVEDRLVLILALIPHIKPSALDILFSKNALYDIPFTEFGGIRQDKHRGFLPTGETAMFLLAGDNIEKRLNLMALFGRDHIFSKLAVLSLDRTSISEPILYGILSISKEYISLFTTGEVFQPDFGPDFPAKLIKTEQEWDDLIINADIKMQLREIENYIKHGKQLKNQHKFGKKIQPGFKVLFTGLPGTGKTLAATLLGKRNDLDVYKVDLSMVVSKYIGETEKNLSRVFDQAENKGWILFFDEADALFGKRSNVSNSHDRYANQEVSYLLQRMESFDGLVILCSNFKKNIDEAFFRRFHLVIDFSMPNAYQRSVLWKQSITSEFSFDKEIDVELLSEQYELSPASIINILHFSILKCLGRGNNVIELNDLKEGLKIERVKEGKSIKV